MPTYTAKTMMGSTKPSHKEPAKRMMHDQNKVMANPRFAKQPLKGVEYTGKR